MEPCDHLGSPYYVLLTEQTAIEPCFHEQLRGQQAHLDRILNGIAGRVRVGDAIYSFIVHHWPDAKLYILGQALVKLYLFFAVELALLNSSEIQESEVHGFF